MSRSLHSNLILVSYIKVLIQIIVKHTPSCPLSSKPTTNKTLCLSSCFEAGSADSRRSPLCCMVMASVSKEENALYRRGASRKISACHNELIFTHNIRTLLLHQETPKANLNITLNTHIPPCDRYLKTTKSSFGLKDIWHRPIQKNKANCHPARNWGHY